MAIPRSGLGDFGAERGVCDLVSAEAETVARADPPAPTAAVAPSESGLLGSLGPLDPFAGAPGTIVRAEPPRRDYPVDLRDVPVGPTTTRWDLVPGDWFPRAPLS